MVGDDDTDRIVAFIHRILQLCISHTDPGFIVGCLILINKVWLIIIHLFVCQVYWRFQSHDWDTREFEVQNNDLSKNRFYDYKKYIHYLLTSTPEVSVIIKMSVCIKKGLVKSTEAFNPHKPKFIEQRFV